MHRKIVEQIRNVIENSPIADDCEVYVQSKKTDGFWAMVVLTNREHLLPHIESVSMAIGRMYGEGLAITKDIGFITIE